MLPKTYFVGLAERSPFLIFQNQLYQLTEEVNTEDYIWIGPRKFGLVAGDSVLRLEDLYRYNNHDAILDFKQNYIYNKLKSEIKSSKDLTKKIKQQKVVEFIVQEVFPLLQSQDDEIAEVINPGTQRKNKKAIINKDEVLAEAYKLFEQHTSQKSRAEPYDSNILESIDKQIAVNCFMSDEDRIANLLGVKEEVSDEQRIEDILKQMTGEDEIDYKGKTISCEERCPRTLLSEILEEEYSEGTLIFNNKIYQLMRVKDENQLIKVRINGLNYFANIPNDYSVGEIEFIYKQALEVQFQDEAEREFNYKEEIDSLLKSFSGSIDNVIEQLSQHGKYEDGRSGIQYYNGNYYVTLKVPPFVLKDTIHNTGYYEFDECTIGVRIIYNSKDKDLGFSTDAVIINKYLHPFVRDETSGWMTICKYSAKYVTNYFAGLSLAERIASFLGLAKYVIESGYTNRRQMRGEYVDYDHGGYRPLSTVGLYKKISKEEIKRRGLCVTNLKADQREDFTFDKDMEGDVIYA